MIYSEPDRRDELETCVKNIFVLMVLLLGGCSYPPVKLDLSAAEELPKSIALEYLNKNTEEFRAGSDAHTRPGICVFTEAGFYKAESGPGKIVKYDQSFMILHYLPMPGTTYTYFISLRPDSGSPFADCIVDNQTKKEKEPPKFFTKIPTALKSLGVKVEKVN